jgi:hypothetical protein
MYVLAGLLGEGCKDVCRQGDIFTVASPRKALYTHKIAGLEWQARTGRLQGGEARECDVVELSEGGGGFEASDVGAGSRGGDWVATALQVQVRTLIAHSLSPLEPWVGLCTH